MTREEEFNNMHDITTSLLDLLEEVCKDIREKRVDDDVCGLCEYDCDHGLDGYANECPGFEKDDCFVLKSSIKEKYLSASENLENELTEAKDTIRKLLCREYGSSCEFCIHDNNAEAMCRKVSGSGSWCCENAAWKGTKK